jgi:hypothetical protein
MYARLRLETGSIWPAIALHGAWNSIIEIGYDRATAGPCATLWVCESGVLVMLTTIAGSPISSAT